MFVDTTLLIDLLRGKREAIEVVKKIESRPLFTSEINVFELIEGVYTSNLNVENHLEKVFALLTRINVLPFDRKAALAAGKISGILTKEGKKIGEVDCLIAGVALANGLHEIITENKEHFMRIPGLKIITY